MVVAGLLLGSRGTRSGCCANAAGPAKIATIATASCACCRGIGLAGTWLAFLLPLIGLGLLFLALIPDDPEARDMRILVVQPELDDPPHLFGELARGGRLHARGLPPLRRRRGAHRSTGTPACW